MILEGFLGANPLLLFFFLPVKATRTALSTPFFENECRSKRCGIVILEGSHNCSETIIFKGGGCAESGPDR